MYKTALSAFAFSLVALTNIASASTVTFNLTQDACTGTCGASPYGVITIVDNGSGNGAFVTVTESLASPERYAGTGAGKALEFNVAGTLTVSNLTAGFAYLPGGASASAFGSFSKAIDCTACQGGQAGNPSGPLTFNLSSATGVTTSMFTPTGIYYFASDIVGKNGNTGNVAALVGTTVPSIPEPATTAMAFTGFALLALGYRNKRKA